MTERGAAAPPATAAYDPGCTRCPRLAAFLRETRSQYPDYWARPVPSFGDAEARILIVGLAPGMHGANRTARPFTGDHAGILLYQTLYEAGLATRPHSRQRATMGCASSGARIANAVKCVPPQNKPLPDGDPPLQRVPARRDARAAAGVRVYLALGRVAHEAVLLARMACKRRTVSLSAHAARAPL